MSQNVTRKKNFKTSQSAAGLPSGNKSKKIDYWKYCLESNPDTSGNNEKKLPDKVTEAGFKNAPVSSNTKLVSRIPTKKKISTSKEDSVVPLKKIKIIEAQSSNNISSNDNNKSPNYGSDRSIRSPAYLSVPRHEKLTATHKNSKLDIFNNVTCSFVSSKILSLQGPVGTQKRLELSSWGLPPSILEKYQARGITSMFPWQVECLANKNLLENNKNLVYSAPTSAGKTLVAEFLLLKTVLERRKKAIFILPFVSVVREKMFYFQDLLSDSGVRVEGFMGGVAPAGGFSSVHIAIATIEKANSLINRLMEENNLDTLGAVVIDELHLLGDPGRGYILELLLTKLKYMTLSLEEVDIQLIGMSATLPNLPLIAEWLDAELYKTEFRPIPLNEQCKIGTSILDSKLNTIRNLEKAPDILNDVDNIIQLCIETINGGHGTLIFCPTKNWCEKLATQMASTFFQLGRDNTPHGQILRKNIEFTAVEEVLAQLERSPVGLDSVLKKTVSFGVAFHHAGLTMDERDIIEGAFRIGSIKVLIATSTLSCGVNLPARRVIIRSPMFNGRRLDRSTYEEMIGRAGRMGKDTAGESILICQQNQRSLAVDLMSSSLEPIVSCLEDSGPLVRALLEAIASQIVRTQKDLSLYYNCTFIYKCEKDEVKELVDGAIKFLVSNEFLLLKESDNSEQRLVATCLGKACLSASIPPRDGLLLFEELQRARKCFVLDTELHVVYLVTPFNSSSQINQIDWMIFMDLWRSLSESERRVGQLVGVEERFLVTAMRGIVKPGKSLYIHQRFFTAMALHDLVREVSLNAVCKKYNCGRGLLQSLQQSSSTFAGMVTNFCKELKWDCMELLFAQFQARLQFGVCRDLLDLLRLPSLNGLRARSLFKHGITTVAELAVASEIDVEDALNKALPFESEKDFDGDNEAEIAKKTKMRTVFITGKDGMTAHEAACVVIKEARALVKNELGVRDVQWSQLNGTSNARSLNSTSINNHISLKSPSLINNMAGSINVSPICNQINLHSVSNISPAARSNIENNSVNVQNVSVEIHVSNNLQNSVKNMEECDNVGVKVAEKQNDANIPNVYFEETDAISNVDKENENRVSDADEIFSNSEVDVINESDKVPITSRTLRSRLAEKTKSLVKDHYTICSADFKDDADLLSDALSETNQRSTPKVDSRTLRSKFPEKSKKVVEIVPLSSLDFEDEVDSSIEKTNSGKNKSRKPSKTLKSKLAEKLQNISKIDHVTLCTMDFQDRVDFKFEKSGEKIEVVDHKNKSKVFSIAPESKSVQNTKNSSKDHFTVCSLDFQDNVEEKINSKNDTTNTNNKSIKISRILRSNISKKTKSPRKDQISVCTLDFADDINLPREKSVQNIQNSEKCQKSPANKENLQASESFQIIDSVFQEVMNVAEKKEHSFALPAQLPAKKTNEELKRISEGGNYSKSPSLFSDSSFLDGQMCSFLEKNIMDSSCLIDFEKTDITEGRESNKIENSIRRATRSNGSVGNKNSESSTPTSVRPVEIMNIQNNLEAEKPSETSVVKKPENVKSKEYTQSITRMTWAEDSWDQTKNILPNKVKDKVSGNDSGSDSPSLLGMTRMRSRLKPLVSNQSVVTEVQATASKEKKPNSPLTNTPKSILRRKIFDKQITGGSPIAAFRSYNTSKTVLPGSPSSIKSDSEDSIVSSQPTEESTKTNKTRIRIEQKILSTQKKFKELGSKKNSMPKVDSNSTPMLVKQNSEPIFDEPSSSDVESIESDAMFDSSEEVKSMKVKDSQKKKSGNGYAPKSLRTGNSFEGEPLKFSTIEPQDVANSKRIFRSFLNEIFSCSAEASLKIKNLSIAFVTEPNSKDPIVSIGSRIVGVDDKKKNKKYENFVYGCKRICGIVVCWSITAIYYIPFSNTKDTKVTIKERMKFLQDILKNPSITLRCFNAKEVYKILFSCCEIESCCNFMDPKIGDWMIDSEYCNKNCTELTAEYFPRGLNLTKNYENNFGTLTQLEIMRSSAKAVLAWYTTEAIINKMKERSPVLLSAFKEIEMPTNISLAIMELRGFGVNIDALKELSAAVKNDMTSIEDKAFGLAGKKFNFNSSKEVAQVLGLIKKGRACTNKKVLMSCENPISNLVTLWRKLSTVLIKTIYPLLQIEKKNNRIHGNCITRTVTGRISMYEPNLQSIPRDFTSEISGCIFSVRMAFIPEFGNVMLSADFCQLELRILAHFSKDPILCKLLHSQGDIFKNIAARLHDVAEDMVNDDMRQRAKQLCYAMIYGMGMKSLAESLSVTESEAKDYFEAFMGTYKGIRTWLKAVCEQARNNGYVSTLTGRRRVLPGIKSDIPVVRAQAERQAVNTKVQGSAADIAKKAMVLIESKLRNEFPNLPITFPTTQSRRNLRSSDHSSRPRGAYLLLQLHDELLFEVNPNDLQSVAGIVKESMEHAFELRVPLPVKVRFGTAWGNLEEYKV